MLVLAVFSTIAFFALGFGRYIVEIALMVLGAWLIMISWPLVVTLIAVVLGFI